MAIGHRAFALLERNKIQSRNNGVDLPRDCDRLGLRLHTPRDTKACGASHIAQDVRSLPITGTGWPQAARRTSKLAASQLQQLQQIAAESRWAGISPSRLPAHDDGVFSLLRCGLRSKSEDVLLTAGICGQTEPPGCSAAQQAHASERWRAAGRPASRRQPANGRLRGCQRRSGRARCRAGR